MWIVEELTENIKHGTTNIQDYNTHQEFYKNKYVKHLKNNYISYWLVTTVAKFQFRDALCNIQTIHWSFLARYPPLLDAHCCSISLALLGKLRVHLCWTICCFRYTHCSVVTRCSTLAAVVSFHGLHSHRWRPLATGPVSRLYRRVPTDSRLCLAHDSAGKVAQDTDSAIGHFWERCDKLNTAWTGRRVWP